MFRSSIRHLLLVAAVLIAVPSSSHARERGAPEARVIQRILREQGHRPGPVDGIVGPWTRSALAAFQQSSGLPPTGRLDRATIERLQDLSVVRAASAAPAGAPRDPLGFDGDESAVDELLIAASVESRRARMAAVRVLGDARTVRARAALGIVLYANDVAEVRVAAARQLGRIGDPASVNALAAALEDEEAPEVRAAIVEEIERNLPDAPIAFPAEGLRLEAPAAEVRPAEPLRVGLLRRTADPRRYRGRVLAGTVTALVNGQFVPVDPDGWFEWTLERGRRAHELYLQVDEIDAQGDASRRIFWLPRDGSPRKVGSIRPADPNRG